MTWELLLWASSFRGGGVQVSRALLLSMIFSTFRLLGASGTPEISCHCISYVHQYIVTIHYLSVHSLIANEYKDILIIVKSW